MTLGHLIKVLKDRRDWLRIDVEWDIINGEFKVIAPNVSLDDEIELYYYWLYGGLPNDEVKEIQDALDNKDYQTFRKYVDRDEANLWWHFPSNAHIFCGDDPIGEICVLYDEDVFNCITHSENEHG